MPSVFTGMDKVHKIKDFFVQLELYFEAQHACENDKMTIIVTFFKEHALILWTQLKDENVKGAATYLRQGRFQVVAK